MAIFLQIIGYGWALLGMTSCLGTAMEVANTGVQTDRHSLAVGMDIILFVVPGIGVGLIGSTMQRRRAKQTECPHCKELIQKGATVCPKCRRDIVPAGLAATPPRPPAGSDAPKGQFKWPQGG